MRTSILVVTRHTDLVDYLIEKDILPEGRDVTVVTHVEEEDKDSLVGKTVYGVLPMHLAALTRTYVNVPLDIPPEMRGKELSLEDIRRFAKPVEYYKIRRVKNPSLLKG